MSFISTNLQVIGKLLRSNLTTTISTRCLSTSFTFYGARTAPQAYRVINKNRSEEIPVEKSIRYLKSTAYKETYGDDPVWKQYRRNFKGQFAPRTRLNCIRNNKISNGSPCPLCRDEYLVLSYKNPDLLKQFLTETGHVLSTKTTGVCRTKHKQLLVEIIKAKDRGIIVIDVPLREYDYSEWMPEGVENK